MSTTAQLSDAWLSSLHPEHVTADLSTRRHRPISAYSAQPRLAQRRSARPVPRSQPREECCVCLRRTSERTACGHALCGYCTRRLRRQICPYCRRDLESTQLSGGGAVSSTAPGGASDSAASTNRRDKAAESTDTTAEVAKFWDGLRRCSTLEDLHEAVATLAPCLKQQPPTVRRSLVSAATRRCCQLLLDGREWCSGSAEVAAASVPFLVGLHEDELLEPLREVQLAALDALVGVCSGGVSTRQRPQSGRREAVPLSARSRGTMVSATTTTSISAALLEKNVRQWAQRARLLGLLAEAGLLPVDGAASVASLLEGELRRRLESSTADDLLQLAAHLQNGGLWIARALLGSSESDGGTGRPAPVAECIRNIVDSALHMAEVTSGASGAASGAPARHALHQAGLVVSQTLGRKSESDHAARRMRPRSSQSQGRPASARGYGSVRRTTARHAPSECPDSPAAAPETVLDLPPEILEPIRARAMAPVGVLRI